jgi:hypothetical protein
VIKIELFDNDNVECCYNLLHWQKFTGNNHGDQKVNFGLQNSLKLTYGHLHF